MRECGLVWQEHQAFHDLNALFLVSLAMIRAVRTDAYEHTISGLLGKRAELFNEAERIRDRLAKIKNDVGALDRVLGTLDYTGDLDAAMPSQKREVLFGGRELSKAIMGELRNAEGPLSSRDIAREIVTHKVTTHATGNSSQN